MQVPRRGRTKRAEFVASLGLWNLSLTHGTFPRVRKSSPVRIEVNMGAHERSRVHPKDHFGMVYKVTSRTYIVTILCRKFEFLTMLTNPRIGKPHQHPGKAHPRAHHSSKMDQDCKVDNELTHVCSKENGQALQRQARQDLARGFGRMYSGSLRRHLSGGAI